MTTQALHCVAGSVATAKAVLRPNAWRRLWPALLLTLAACGSVPKAPISSPVPSPGNPVTVGQNSGPTVKNTTKLPTLPAAGSGRGGYYQDDGPGDKPPEGLLDLPDPIPKIEPYSTSGNKPYVVFGKTYTPITDSHSFKQRGIGSWYGKKFHGQKTSSGELYDMYKLTAAHPTLPIPSYARVTNLSNGAQVIVRINDRGPFHSSRIIDLSYTAALKLGYLGNGSSELEVERLLPEDIERIAAAGRQSNPAPTAPERASETLSPSDAPVLATPTALAVSATSATPVSANALEDAPSTAEPVPGSPGVYYLQLGAFADLDNAEATRARLMQHWDLSLPLLEVAHIGMFYRVSSGPYASRTDAMLAAQRVQELCNIKPLVVLR